MRIPERIFERIYFFLFTWLCLGELSALLAPQTDVYTYYHVLSAFHPSATIYYILAVSRALITIVCLPPLFIYAFNRNKDWTWFYKPLLFVRVTLDVTGHNYEWQFLKTLYHTAAFTPIAALSVWVGITFLSYKAHFLCAYKPNKKVQLN